MMATCVDNSATALHLASSGFAVFPCQSGGPKAKQPMPFIRWREASTTDVTQINSWWRKWPDAAVGLDLAKSGLLVIDADRHGADDGVHAFGQLMAEHQYEPHGVPLAATPNEGTHFFYRQPDGKQFGNGTGSLPAGVDVRGHGGYVIAPGTKMADGRLYEVFGDIAEAPVLPDWIVEVLETRRAAEPTVATYSSVPTSGSEIEDLLSFISPDCGYHDWVAVLMAIHAETQGTGFAIADRWSSGGSKYPGSKELAKKWNSFKSGGITGRTLAQLAREGGADLSAISLRHNGVAEVDRFEAAAAARRLIEHHDGTLADAETGEVVEIDVPSTIADKMPIYPPGLVGDLARWIADTARRPQPELAIGAALAIVGTAAGRQFAGPTMSGTHLYVLGLAPTGKGKDHPLQAIGRIMAAAGLSSHLGPSEFISMPAVVNFLTRRPLSLCAMDEFGGFMKRINSKRASGFEGAISKVIRTMWSSSFAPYFTPEWAQKASETIFAPAMTLFGASTSEQFYASMEGAALEDGTLNRFLLINGRDKVKERDPSADPARVPINLTDGLKGIYNRSGPLAVTYRNDCHTDPAGHDAVRVITWCADGSLERYSAFGEEVEAIIDGDVDKAPFFARTVEMALRIATIIAVGRCDDDQLRVGDLEFGITLAMESASSMAAGAADYMADNENQANAQKVMRCIRNRGGRVNYRDLLRSLQNSIKARDLRDLLQAMHDAGQIERQEVKPPSGPPTFWYQVMT